MGTCDPHSLIPNSSQKGKQSDICRLLSGMCALTRLEALRLVLALVRQRALAHDELPAGGKCSVWQVQL